MFRHPGGAGDSGGGHKQRHRNPSGGPGRHCREGKPAEDNDCASQPGIQSARQKDSDQPGARRRPQERKRIRPADSRGNPCRIRSMRHSGYKQVSDNGRVGSRRLAASSARSDSDSGICLTRRIRGMHSPRRISIRGCRTVLRHPLCSIGSERCAADSGRKGGYFRADAGERLPPGIHTGRTFRRIYGFLRDCRPEIRQKGARNRGCRRAQCHHGGLTRLRQDIIGQGNGGDNASPAQGRGHRDQQDLLRVGHGDLRTGEEAAVQGPALQRIPRSHHRRGKRGQHPARGGLPRA